LTGPRDELVQFAGAPFPHNADIMAERARARGAGFGKLVHEGIMSVYTTLRTAARARTVPGVPLSRAAGDSNAGRGIRLQSSNGFEASKAWPAARQACSSRAAVLIEEGDLSLTSLISPATSELE
jgi:hypothetical protein